MRTRKYQIEKEHSTITSLELAEMAGKPHNDLLKAIRKMEPVWTQITEGKFSLIDYTDSKGRAQPVYVLKKTECLYISSKFSDEIRARLVLRWEELERNLEQRLIAGALEEKMKNEDVGWRRLEGHKNQQYTTLEVTLKLELSYLEACEYLKEWRFMVPSRHGWKSYYPQYTTPYIVHELSAVGVIEPKTYLLWNEEGLRAILERAKEEIRKQDKVKLDEFVRTQKAALGMS